MSSITLQINPALEQNLREKAARKGVGLDSYIQSLLEKVGNAEPIEPHISRLSKEEEGLLEKASLGLSEEFWEKYRGFVAIKETRFLTESERAEFIAMTDQVEAANARRMKYLVKLAQLRQVPLLQLMEQLGIKGGGYA